MAERSTITQVAQIGVETTEGTSVAANKALQSLMIKATPKIDTSRFSPQGYKADTLVVPNKDWTQANISGVPTYDEIVYPLSSVLCTSAAVTTTGTTGKLWTFAPSATTEDTVKTYTVEIGSAVRAHKFTYGLVTDFGLKFNRGGAEISGAMIGQVLTDGITLTASPTALPLVPVIGSQVSVYIDPTSGALGTTKLLRVFEMELSIGNRFTPIWVLNAANGSFAAHVESRPDLAIKGIFEADAVGMGLLTTMRAGGTSFVRIEAVGPVIGAGPATEKLTVDAAIKWESVDSLDDTDNVYTVGLSGRLVYDSTWTKFLNVAVINSTAAL